ncbi:hypothetical protein KSP40_PGU001980 [Platanthera guangdongensis]|uniref:Secreted protein n=1 Tax=Platanthera guangdongensis TaxID=2320717 RepID=A0ABR2LWT0_9ASPA
MVFNGGWVLMVARASAVCCQYIACNPERLSSDQVFHLLFSLPLHHLRRAALFFFSFLRPPPRSPPAIAVDFDSSPTIYPPLSPTIPINDAGYHSHSD